MESYNETGNHGYHGGYKGKIKMIKLKTLIESYIRIEKSPTDLTVADGEAGRGIYFSLQRYGDMVKYYKQNSPKHRVIRATLKPGAKVIDFTKSTIELINFMRNEIGQLKKRMGNTYIPPKITQSNYQRYGRLIQDFIRKNHSDAAGYVVNHEAKGTDLPKGKQLIVLNKDAFNYEDINNL